MTDRLRQALGEIGKNGKARRALLDAIRRVEAAMAARDVPVRDEVIAPLVDALHADIGELAVKLANGIVFHFPYRSKIARELVLSPQSRPDHVWEPQTTRLLLQLSRDARNVAVGGAYSGDHAILIAHQLRGRAGLVHCFEPNQEQMRFLRKNAEANGLDNLVFNEVGLWEDDDSRLVLVGSDSHAHAEPAEPGRSGAFSTVTLDTYGPQAGIDGLELIMLDIEGGEFAALKGARHYLSMPPESAPNVVFEVHRNYIDWSDGLQNTDILRFLTGLGYTVFALRDYQGNVPMGDRPLELVPPDDIYLDGPPHGFNMVAVKKPDILRGELFRVCRGVSPKYLAHRDPALHAPLDAGPARPDRGADSTT